MHDGILDACLGGIFDLHLAVDAHADIRHSHNHERKDRDYKAEFDGNRTACVVCCLSAKGTEAEYSMQPIASRAWFPHLKAPHYSTSCAVVEPIAAVPSAAQSTLRFDVPLKVSVSAMIFVQEVLVPLPPLKFRSAFGR